MKYVALLRGINVGGNKKVPMKDLCAFMKEEGLQDVHTLLASGNVVFTSNAKDSAVQKQLEALIKKNFGFDVLVILRTFEAIHTLVKSNPFASITVNADTRLYVTFLSQKPSKAPLLPYASPEKDFRILGMKDGTVYSVLQLSPQRRTIDSMEYLEKVFGKNITTRNWNTVVKIAQQIHSVAEN